MAKLIEEQTFGLAWNKVLKCILDEGYEVSPRGIDTYEVMSVTLVVNDGLENILVNHVRDMNYRFMIAEWLWILGGLNDVESLAKYNSVMRSFSDNGEIMNGAYGPKLFPQWEYVCRSLVQPWSRQAVATIWTANPGPSKDIPCTLCLQWLIREGKLHCIVTMRSSDAWLGLPYDFFTFSQLTNSVASILNIQVGSITMNLASSHLYRRDWANAYKIGLSYSETIKSPILPPLFPSRENIKSILNGDYPIGEDIWDGYQRALAINKANALEVLHELNSSKY